MNVIFKKALPLLALLLAVALAAASCGDKLTVESTDGEQSGSSLGESGQSSPDSPTKEPALTPMPPESESGEDALTPSGNSPSEQPSLSPSPSKDPTVDPSPSKEDPSPTPPPSEEPTPTPPSEEPTPSEDEPVEPTTLPYTPFYPEDKVVAFTFDDGPEKNTTALLDLLEGTGDKVTFFINGYYVNAGNYRPVIKRAYDMGHEFGLHTYSHKNLFSGGKDADEALIKEEIGKIAQMYTDITGDTTFLLRPPGGNFNEKRNYGYAIVMWSVDSLDWEYAGKYYNGTMTLEEAAQKTADRILSKVRSGDIVLMHDIHPTTIRAFEIVRAQLKSEGYRFVTVSELLGINDYEHTGQYFFASYYYGEQGVVHQASKASAAMTLAPITREEE